MVRSGTYAVVTDSQVGFCEWGYEA